MRPQVYFDISIGGEPAGRMTFELFSDIVPITSENFRALAVGNKTPLKYAGSSFNRVIPGFMAQGGEDDIYGAYFVDKTFDVKHSKRGILTMGNDGQNRNTTQFHITFGPAPALDGKHVAFGEVIDTPDNHRLLDLIENTPTSRHNAAPVKEIKIEKAGQL
ncbi:cyclophilin-like domain-containing protein [Microdochium trichocladiopsis]|uniref:Peptidyl-prolyl cis-trans isomerase n=1 Tax=Microdochium trichocladiopsis TaxID=1682393 RepID=A0A9P9BUP4_9PEZI|nr:cyclophilin-like domain-containing protein [Microdochium trichocladiopsis]KAH7031654.1 cyclophilin-like domain-containing protein [Microdochium trichocladiopsis]